MKTNTQKAETEAERFDTVVRKLLSVSHEEIQKRDKEWRRKRAQKKRAKTSPASRASGSKV
jgi:U3 small nucleolar ribonucleoprotein component